jgi:hypothetical protein
MNIIDRVKNILLTPKTEWPVIDQEADTVHSVLTKYVLPLVLLGALAAFIGYGIVGYDMMLVKIKGIKWGAYFAISQILSSVIGFYVATYVIDALAPSFGSTKSLNKSAQLVAYANTPAYVAALFMFVPSLGFIGLIGLYGIYLFYIGLPVLKGTPEDKRVVYMIVAALVIIVVGAAVQWIAHSVLNMVLGNPFAETTVNLEKLLGK